VSVLCETLAVCSYIPRFFKTYLKCVKIVFKCLEKFRALQVEIGYLVYSIRVHSLQYAQSSLLSHCLVGIECEIKVLKVNNSRTLASGNLA